MEKRVKSAVNHSVRPAAAASANMFVIVVLWVFVVIEAGFKPIKLCGGQVAGWVGLLAGGWILSSNLNKVALMRVVRGSV